MNSCQCCKSAHRDIKFDSSLITTGDDDEELLSDTLLAELGERSLSWFDDLTEAYFVQQQTVGDKHGPSPGVVAGWSPCPRGGVFSAGDQVPRTTEMTPMTALLSSSGNSSTLKPNSSAVVSSPPYEHLGEDQEAIKWTSAMATPFQDGSTSSASLDETDWRDISTAADGSTADDVIVTDIQEKPKVFHRQLFSPAQSSWTNDSLSDVLEEGDITVEQERTVISTEDNSLSIQTAGSVSVKVLENEKLNLSSTLIGHGSVLSEKETQWNQRMTETLDGQQMVMYKRDSVINSKPNLCSVVQRKDEDMFEDASLCLDETLCAKENTQQTEQLESRSTSFKEEKKFDVEVSVVEDYSAGSDDVLKAVTLGNTSKVKETVARSGYGVNSNEFNMDTSFAESLSATEMEMIEQQCSDVNKTEISHTVPSFNGKVLSLPSVYDEGLRFQRKLMADKEQLTSQQNLISPSHIEAVLCRVFSSQGSSSSDCDVMACKKEKDVEENKSGSKSLLCSEIVVDDKQCSEIVVDDKQCSEIVVDDGETSNKTEKTLMNVSVHEGDSRKEKPARMSKERQSRRTGQNVKKRKVCEEANGSITENKTERSNNLSEMEDSKSKQGVSNLNRLLSDSSIDTSLGLGKVFSTPASILKSQLTPKSLLRKRVRFSIDSSSSESDIVKTGLQDDRDLIKAHDKRQLDDLDLIKAINKSQQDVLELNKASEQPNYPDLPKGDVVSNQFVVNKSAFTDSENSVVSCDSHSQANSSDETVIANDDTLPHRHETVARIIGGEKSSSGENYIDKDININSHTDLPIIPDSELDELGNDDESLATFPMSQLEKKCFDSNRNLVREPKDCDILLSSQVEELSEIFDCDRERVLMDTKNAGIDTEFNFDDSFGMSPTFSSQVLASSQVEGKESVGYGNVQFLEVDSKNVTRPGTNSCDKEIGSLGQGDESERLSRFHKDEDDRNDKPGDDFVNSYFRFLQPSESQSHIPLSSSATRTAIPDPLSSSSSLLTNSLALPDSVVSSSLDISCAPMKLLPGNVSKTLYQNSLLSVNKITHTTPSVSGHSVPLSVSKTAASESTSLLSMSLTTSTTAACKRPFTSFRLLTNKPRKFLYPSVQEIEAVCPDVAATNCTAITHSEEIFLPKESNGEITETKLSPMTPVITDCEEVDTNHSGHLGMGFGDSATVNTVDVGLRNCAPPRKVPKLLGFAKFSDVFQEPETSSDMTVNSATATKPKEISTDVSLGGAIKKTNTDWYKSKILSAKSLALQTDSHTSKGKVLKENISRNINSEQFQGSFHMAETEPKSVFDQLASSCMSTDCVDKFITTDSPESKAIRVDEEMPQISSQVWEATEFSQILKLSTEATNTSDNLSSSSYSEDKANTVQISSKDLECRSSQTCKGDGLEKRHEVCSTGSSLADNIVELRNKISESKNSAGFSSTSNLSVLTNLDNQVPLTLTAKFPIDDVFEDQLEGIFAARKQKSVVRPSFKVPFKNQNSDSHEAELRLKCGIQTNRNLFTTCEPVKDSDRENSLHRQQADAHYPKQSHQLTSSKLDDFDKFLNGFVLNGKENRILPSTDKNYNIKDFTTCNSQDQLQQTSARKKQKTGKENFSEVSSISFQSACGNDGLTLFERPVEKAVATGEGNDESQREKTQIRDFSTAKGSLIYVSDKFKRQAEKLMESTSMEDDMTLNCRVGTESKNEQSNEAGHSLYENFNTTTSKLCDVSKEDYIQTEELKKSTEVLNDGKESVGKQIFQHQQAKVLELRQSLKKAQTEGLMSVLSNPLPLAVGFSTAGGKQILLTESSKAKARQQWETVGKDLNAGLPCVDLGADSDSDTSPKLDFNPGANSLKDGQSCTQIFSTEKNVQLETSTCKKPGVRSSKKNQRYKGFDPFKHPNVVKKKNYLSAETCNNEESLIKDACELEDRNKVPGETGLQSDVVPEQIVTGQCYEIEESNKNIADDWEDDSNLKDLIESDQNIDVVIKQCNGGLADQNLVLEDKDNSWLEHGSDINMERLDDVCQDTDQVHKIQSEVSTVKNKSISFSNVDCQQVTVHIQDVKENNTGNCFANHLSPSKELVRMSEYSSVASVGEKTSSKDAVTSTKIHNASSFIQCSRIVKDNETETNVRDTNVTQSLVVCSSPGIESGVTCMDRAHQNASDISRNSNTTTCDTITESILVTDVNKTTTFLKPDNIEIGTKYESCQPAMSVGFSLESCVQVPSYGKALLYTSQFFDASEKPGLNESNQELSGNMSIDRCQIFSSTDSTKSSSISPLSQNRDGNNDFDTHSHLNIVVNNRSRTISPKETKTAVFQRAKGCEEILTRNTKHMPESDNAKSPYPHNNKTTISLTHTDVSTYCNYGSTKGTDGILESGDANNRDTPINPHSVGFSTATGLKVSLSEKTLKCARGFLNESESERTLDKDQSAIIPQLRIGLSILSSSKDLVSGQDFLSEVLDKEQIDCKEKSRPTPSKPMGFSTASGSKVTVSHKAMEHGKQFFVESDTCLSEKETTTNLTTAPPIHSGFSTASGLKVSVSDRAVKFAQDFFMECESTDVSEETKTKPAYLKDLPVDFSAATEFKCSVSEKALKQRQNLCSEFDGNGSVMSKEANVKASTTPQMTIDFSTASTTDKDDKSHTKTYPASSLHMGFSTASGCKVSVSDKALKHATDFFIKSDNDSSNIKSMSEEEGLSKSLEATVGFSTASGAKVTVSDTALKQIKQGFGDPDSCRTLGQISSLKNSRPSMAGFSTAIGLEGEDSRHALLHTSALLGSKQNGSKDKTEPGQPSLKDNGAEMLSTTNLDHRKLKGNLEQSNWLKLNRGFHTPVKSRCEDFLLDRKNVTGRRLDPLISHSLTTNHGDSSLPPVNNSALKQPSKKIPTRDGERTIEVGKNHPHCVKDAPVELSNANKTFIPPPQKTPSVSSSRSLPASSSATVTNRGLIKRVPVFNPKRPDIKRKETYVHVVNNLEPECDLDNEEENKLLCQEVDAHDDMVGANLQKDNKKNVGKEEEMKNTEGEKVVCLPNDANGIIPCKSSHLEERTSIQNKTQCNYEPSWNDDNELSNKITKDQMLTRSEPQNFNPGLLSALMLPESVLEEGRMRQEKIIRMKRRKRVRPLCGRWIQTRKRKKNLKHLEELGKEFVQDWMKEQFLACGISGSTLNINSLNAREFRFDLHRVFPCLSSSVLVGDGALMVPDRFAFVGVKEFFSAFLTIDGVDPALVDETWVENHYRWIVWKLASYEIALPHQFAGRSLTPDHVMLQLKYRYDREIDGCQRSAFKKILEKDDTPCKRMVLCVASVTKDIDGQFSVELTDGWYSIRAQIDSALTDLVARKRLGPGDKIVTSGAELVGSQDACNPLEVKEGTQLKLHGNSTRPAPWHTRLGFSYPPSALCVPLNSLSPGGGMVGCVDVVVVRKYPVMFMEKLPDGGSIFRTAEEEDRTREKYENQKQSEMEKIYSSLQLESESTQRGHKRGCTRLSRKEIENLWTGQELADAMDSAINPEELQEMLSHCQIERLMEHKRVEMDRRQEMMNKRLQEAMANTGGEPRNVSPVQKFKVCGCCRTDVSANSNCVLTVWRPGPQWTEVVEGKRYQMFNLSVTAARGRTDLSKISLTATRQTHLETAVISDNLLRLVFEPRETRMVSDLTSRQPGDEFDFAGVVVRVDLSQRTNGPNLVYAVDQDCQFICMRLWSGSQISNFKTSECFTALNLVLSQNLQQAKKGRSQLLTADARLELTVFTFSGHSCRYPDAFSRVEKLSKTKGFLARMEEQLDKQLTSTVPGHKDSSCAYSHNYEAYKEDFPPEIIEKIFSPMSQDLINCPNKNTGKLKCGPAVMDLDNQGVLGTIVSCTIDQQNETAKEPVPDSISVIGTPKETDPGCSLNLSNKIAEKKRKDHKRKLEKTSKTEYSTTSQGDSQKLPNVDENSEDSELLKKRKLMLREKMTKLLAYDRPSPLRSLPNSSSPASGKGFKSPLLKKKQ